MRTAEQDRLYIEGLRVFRTYRTWEGMKARCRSNAPDRSSSYAARGISVCERWRKFENFLHDMGPRPDGLTLERIDNDGNYEPSNCKWATRRGQANNVRRTVRLPVNGELIAVSYVAEKMGMKPGTLSRRLRRGWSFERALSTPTIKWGQNAGL